ncbi:hypothetical protein HCH_02811 [Hahella chejuensis KCTC 2396]|uniref:Tle cognate immunity protein 4 C-terminal domain-containing protein n=1 Tax=Hahella chejuensis (strain KCTC 2396) TaxID=349521 RepID=Q2SID5_HAHCH|nr:hypothetical protein [Hahella chejuensis]ABC29589.1 hypothetical protein HCH_02811 [Hahella chejuensis KCTC 2396]
MIKQLVRPVLTGKGPNFSDLTAKECGIGDFRLQYKLPGNSIYTGRPRKPTPERVNLQRDLFDTYRVQQKFNRTFVQMEFEWWAYRGLFLQGYFGKLSELIMDIDVNRGESHTPFVAGDLDSLESYLKKDYWEYYETEKNRDGEPGANWQARYNFDNPDEVRAKGYIPFDTLVLVRLPENYDRVSINGEEWLHYAIRGEGIPGPRITYYWAYPLTESYYLTFSFWLTTEIGNRDMRAQRMYEDAKRIMSMVELMKG